MPAEVAPKDTMVEFNLGWAYVARAKDVLGQGPSIPEHDRKAAEADLARAEKHLRASVRIDPNNGEAQGNLGGVLYMEKRFDEAYEHLAVALRLKPKDPIANANLARVLLAEGKLDDGIKQLRAYLKLRPDDGRMIQALEQAEAMKAARDSQP